MVYTYNNQLAQITTANPDLNGSGAMESILTAADSGTIVTSISITATRTTTPGMIRLFLEDTTPQKYLFQEIMVPAVTQTGVSNAYHSVINLPLVLQTGYSLYASTEFSEIFSIVVNAANWDNCPCS